MSLIQVPVKPDRLIGNPYWRWQKEVIRQGGIPKKISSEKYKNGD